MEHWKYTYLFHFKIIERWSQHGTGLSLRGSMVISVAFLVVRTGGQGTTGIWCCKTSNNAQQSSHNKDLWGLNISSEKVEKPCCNYIFFIKHFDLHHLYPCIKFHSKDINFFKITCYSRMICNLKYITVAASNALNFCKIQNFFEQRVESFESYCGR